jgi:hypothetical protein
VTDVDKALNHWRESQMHKSRISTLNDAFRDGWNASRREALLEAARYVEKASVRGGTDLVSGIRRLLAKEPA